MNYIWDLALKAKINKIPEKNIKFVPGKTFSPYIELSLNHINENNVLNVVEINPYYRFYKIFSEIFDINNFEDEGLRSLLFDIVVHFLAQVDLMMGMNKKEYYIKFIISDIESGIFGENISERFNYFNKREKEIVAKNVLSLYTIEEPIFLLKDSIQKIFKNTIILSNVREKDEVIFFLGEKKTVEGNEKLEFLKEFFLPFKFNIEVYWEYIFGIFDIDDVMEMDKIVIY